MSVAEIKTNDGLIIKKGNFAFVFDQTNDKDLFDQCLSAEKNLRTNYTACLNNIRVGMEDLGEYLQLQKYQNDKENPMTKEAAQKQVDEDLDPNGETKATKKMFLVYQACIFERKTGKHNAEKASLLVDSYKEWHRFNAKRGEEITSLKRIIQDLYQFCSGFIHGERKGTKEDAENALIYWHDLLALLLKDKHRFDPESVPMDDYYRIPRSAYAKLGFSSGKNQEIYVSEDGNSFYVMKSLDKPLYKKEVAMIDRIYTDSMESTENIITRVGTIGEKEYQKEVYSFRTRPYSLSSDVAYNRINVTNRHSLMQGLVGAVKAMHSLNPPIAHRTLNPNSVYLCFLNLGIKPVVVNFEAAKDILTESEQTAMPWIKQAMRNTEKKDYLAPELENDDNEDLPKADIYSLGRLFEYICKGDEKDYQDLIRKMTSIDPEQRPDIREVEEYLEKRRKTQTEETGEKTVMLVKKAITDLKVLVFSRNYVFKAYDVSHATFVGRKPDPSLPAIFLESPIVSRIHGRFFEKGGYYYYEDLQSTNGTIVDGALIGRHSDDSDQVKLKDGMSLKIDYVGESSEHRDAVVMVALQNTYQKLSSHEIIIEEGEQVELGRTAGQGIVTLNDSTVSRRHALLIRDGGFLKIEDSGSTNGVLVNGRKIIKGDILKPTDVIMIGATPFVVTERGLCYCVGEEDRKSLSIRISKREVRSGHKKVLLLKDINLDVNAGEMVMILGGSGAGKTTFVNAVTGYEPAEGKILHDSVDLYRDYSKVKDIIGFAPQDDALRGEDTVYNTLKNAAQIRMRNAKRQLLEERVDSVIGKLGLQKERDTLASKISGGQRKRLSIAMELIADPSIFILDEPDSGLDGPIAKDLMLTLRGIADEGKVVMVITHSPDRVRELFNKVIVLAKSESDNAGHLAFYGSVSEAFSFFDTDSLESVVKKVNGICEGGDGMADHYIAKFKGEYEGTH